MNFCKDCEFCKILNPKFLWFFFPFMRICHYPKYKVMNYVTGKSSYVELYCGTIRSVIGSHCKQFISKLNKKESNS